MVIFNLEDICFKIISLSGSAKSYAFEAIDSAEEGKINEAHKLIEKARDDIIEAEKVHFTLMSHEAQGNKLDYNILLIHSEDQMMSASLMIDMAERMIHLYEKIGGLNE